MSLKSVWKWRTGGRSADGSTSLRFELSGSCHYHLGDHRLADLKDDVVHLLTTEPDGLVRAVKGSRVNLQAHAYAGAPTYPAGARKSGVAARDRKSVFDPRFSLQRERSPRTTRRAFCLPS